MKKLILLLAMVTISHSIVFSQGCLPEGITFTTQAQINNFPIWYAGCTVIDGDVYVYGTDIINLDSLNQLDSIGGKFVIHYNDALTSITGLDSLVYVGGDLVIKNNLNLTSISGLGLLVYVGGKLEISTNYNLPGITGFSSLDHVGWNMEILSNLSLTSITGLTVVSYIGGSLFFGSNSWCGLPEMYKLTAVSNDLILSNSGFTNLTGLDSLTYVGGKLLIAFNSQLENLWALNKLTSIGQSFDLNGNSSLTNLTGLENLITIVGDLRIIGTDGLINLEGLNNLITVAGNLYISNNTALTSLEGLDSLNHESIYNLTIWNNSLLSFCNIPSICDYLANPNGGIYIGLNAPGCYSNGEVFTACFGIIDDIEHTGEICISPNPTTTFITINIKEGIPIEEAIIYNHFGQKALVAVPVNNTVDVSTLKPGIYFLEVATKDWRGRTKLIKE